MQQLPTHRCSRCGTEVDSNQRFCSNCGASIDKDIVRPTEPISDQNFIQHSGASTPPPPPDLDQYSTIRQQPNYMPMASTESTFNPSAYANPTQGQSVPPPNYAMPPYAVAPQKDNTGKILGRIGCGALLIFLLIFALCGGISYAIYLAVAPSFQKTATHSTTTNSYGTSTNTSSTPAPTPIKTIPLNLSLKYSTINYTIMDMKQATSFDDDQGGSDKPGVVRVDLKEVNSNSSSTSFAYSEVVRLLLPDGSSVPPQSSKNLSPPANGVSQENWLDFPVPMNTALDKLVLRFGNTQQAQMDVPLKAGTDLAQFQDITIKPNTTTNYAGLKWTLTSATHSWSGYDKQADNGKRYVIINLSVDNPSGSSKSAYWGEYLRLQAGSSISAPDTDSTLPTSFAAGSTGTAGNAIFLVPQESTSFTILLLADKFETGSPQATISFHIP